MQTNALNLPPASDARLVCAWCGHGDRRDRGIVRQTTQGPHHSGCLEAREESQLRQLPKKSESRQVAGHPPVSPGQISTLKAAEPLSPAASDFDREIAEYEDGALLHEYMLDRSFEKGGF